MKVLGIESKLRSPRANETIGKVLRQIKRRNPEDFNRLQRLVREILPVSTAEAEQGTLGEIKHLCLATEEDPSTWWKNGGVGSPCDVKINETAKHLAAVVAHEFGHVCTRLEDLIRRGDCPSEEWQSELAADWYAYRWGFGRSVAQSRRSRDAMHHGPQPQTEYLVCGQRYRITRNFVSHHLGPEVGGLFGQAASPE